MELCSVYSVRRGMRQTGRDVVQAQGFNYALTDLGGAIGMIRESFLRFLLLRRSIGAMENLKIQVGYSSGVSSTPQCLVMASSSALVR